MRLWISYPWACKEERDFSYLVAALRRKNIQATYDSFELRPDSCFWQRVEQRLSSVDFDGWLYILTHQLISRRTCANELITAIDKISQGVGPDFPMIGLMYGVAGQQVHSAFKVRPCFSAFDPDWPQQVSQTLSARAKTGTHRRAPRDEMRYYWKVHSCYGGNPSMTAIEVRPKDEGIQYWRFAIPRTAQTVMWGVGPAGGTELSPIRFWVARGSARYGTDDVTWFGAANSISMHESAYVVFSGPLPQFICFGPAKSSVGAPGPMEVFQVRHRPNLS